MDRLECFFALEVHHEAIPTALVGLILLGAGLVAFIVMFGRHRVEQIHHPTQTPTLPVWVTVPFPNVRIRALALTPDGTRLVVVGGTQDQAAREHPIVLLWDIEGGKEVATLHQPDDGGRYKAVAVNPDGKSVAIGGWLDVGEGLVGTVRVWNLETGKPRWSASPKYGVNCAAWSPDGSQLAAGNSYDGTVTVWGANGSNQRIAWQPRMSEGGSISALAWSHDGKRMVHASSGAAHVWEVESGREIAAAIPHPYFHKQAKEEGRVVAVSKSERDYFFTAFAFARDDRSVFVAGRQKGDLVTGPITSDIWVWDLASNAESRSLACCPMIVWELALGPNRQSLITINPEGSKSPGAKIVARGWDINTGQELWIASMLGTGFPDTSTVASGGKRLALARQLPDSELWAVNVYDLPSPP